jgi:hypothetical protein
VEATASPWVQRCGLAEPRTAACLFLISRWPRPNQFMRVLRLSLYNTTSRATRHTAYPTYPVDMAFRLAEGASKALDRGTCARIILPNASEDSAIILNAN